MRGDARGVRRWIPLRGARVIPRAREIERRTEPFTLGLWGKPHIVCRPGSGRDAPSRRVRRGSVSSERTETMCPLSFVQKLDGNTDAFARSGRHHARSSRRFRCRWRFAQRKKARGVLMLARTPARHTRRCDATANTRVRLFPNVSVCGCVVRRGDDHRSGAERCAPAPGSRGIFQAQVNFSPCHHDARLSRSVVHNLISRDENFGPAGALRSLLGAHPQAVSPFVVMGKKSAPRTAGTSPRRSGSSMVGDTGTSPRGCLSAASRLTAARCRSCRSRIRCAPPTGR